MPDNMEHHALTLSVLMLVINYITSSDVQTPDVSLKEHVKKLDEMLAEIQSHSQAQEQSNRVILTKLLSQLIQTTNELADLKTSHNETVQKLEEKDAELSELWANHNETIRKLEQKVAQFSEFSTGYNETVVKLESTLIKCEGNVAQLSKLLASHNETALKLESTNLNLKEKDEELSKLWASHNATSLNVEEHYTELSKLWASQNATAIELIASHHSVEMDLAKTKHDLEVFEKRPDSNGYIGFQGRISKGRNVTAKTPVNYDDISYNAGDFYDNSTGTFTIPTSGTYLIWIEFSYQRPADPFVFIIYKERGYVIDQAYGIRSISHETTSTTTMTYLHEGESIWVAPSVNVFMDHYFCSFGIVLLNAH